VPHSAHDVAEAPPLQVPATAGSAQPGQLHAP